MKPFVQQQPRSGGRWLVLVGTLAVGFAAWFFDLLPQLRSVPTGEVAQETLLDAPELPESWDNIIDRTDESAVSESESNDPLLNFIEDVDGDTSFADFNELTEPDLSVEPSGIAAATSTESDETADVMPVGLSSDASSDELPASSVVRALATDSTVAPVLSAESADVLRRVDALLKDNQIVDAHYELSTLYWKHPEQRPAFQQRIQATAAAIFTDPEQHFSEPYLVLPGDTLESIGQRYQVPWHYLSRLNRVKPEELQAGQTLKVLRGPFSAVVDLHRFELTVEAHGYYVQHYDIGTGRADSTPVGAFTVEDKLENPTWFNPDGGQVDADDPNNPLGEYWIGLGEHIGIHGTIDPDSIGTRRSRGCIHMRDADIAEVFGLLGAGSAVRIRP